MRDYEAMLVLSPELDDAGVNQAVERTGDIIEREQGELALTGVLANKKGDVARASGEWRVRKLAYAISGHREGYYVVLRFSGPTELPGELERTWRLNEDVLRYLVLRTDEALPEIAPLAEIEERPQDEALPEDEMPSEDDAPPEDEAPSEDEMLPDDEASSEDDAPPEDEMPSGDEDLPEAEIE